jgi:hypothetical protein
MARMRGFSLIFFIDFICVDQLYPRHQPSFCESNYGPPSPLV